jgi:hypothetical protein
MKAERTLATSHVERWFNQLGQDFQGNVAPVLSLG